jgi:AraC-like DNA-binding protein
MDGVSEAVSGEALEVERPFFAEASRRDRTAYLRPSPTAGGISVGEHRRDRRGGGVSDPNPPAEIYHLPVILRDLPAHAAWRDDRRIGCPARPRGSIACYDLRQVWRAEVDHPFHTIDFYVPQAAFDELTEEAGRARIEALDCPPTEITPDPVAYHLALALAPALRSGEGAPSLLADQILDALRLHLATRYGGFGRAEAPAGRFTAAQRRELRALMLDDPARDVRLGELAQACSMPLRQFERAFRAEFGASPHQWRLAAKIGKARRLIELTDRPLAEIAVACGFCDQSHLTRVFTRAVGVAPGGYRRARRG